MSKFIMFGMPLSQVIACATVNAARVFPAFDDRGTLNVGAPADVAIMELREGTFEFLDNYKGTRTGRQRLFPAGTVLAGKRRAGARSSDASERRGRRRGCKAAGRDARRTTGCRSPGAYQPVFGQERGQPRTGSGRRSSCLETSPWFSAQIRRGRSDRAFITLVHAATKSFTNFSFASAQRIDFRERAQLRVRAEDQVDAGAGPLDLARLAVAALVDAVGAGGRLPLRAHVEQVDEEVVRQRLRAAW